MHNKIVLSKSGERWMATHYGPRASAVLKAFGTATIPTAYMTAHQTFDMVAMEIAKANINTEVWSEDGRSVVCLMREERGIDPVRFPSGFCGMDRGNR